ncbi:MAG: ribonuclease R, partial [Neofamilia sp.]
DILGIRGRDTKAVYQCLKSMEKEGLIFRDKKERYSSIDNDSSFEGIVDMAEKGFAFIVLQGRDDIFVSRDDLGGAMDGDTVIVSLKKDQSGRSKQEGYVERIVKRGVTQLVGTMSIMQKDEYGFVIPDNKSANYDIFIKNKNLGDAKDGQKVLVSIVKYPENGKNPEGKVLEVLGYPGDKGVDVLSIAHSHGIRMEFPNKVLNQAQEMPAEIDSEDVKGRVDLRDELIFTIDGADAKDLDDAISARILENGNYYLGVHIADVAHYVREGSPIDKEARIRGTSVYLLDRVIPMLPPELSNGICSLHPDVDRLTLSVLMEINKQGKVIESQIVESVINSKARLVYDDVSDYLETKDQESLEKIGSDVASVLDIMAELMEILNKKRHDKGSIDFNFVEGYIEVDENGKVVDIYKLERRISNRLIEEFMLITNETVSESYFWAEIPFLYRIHEYPDEEKLNVFLHFIRGLGYSVKGVQNEIHPRELQHIIEDVAGKKEEAVVSRMMLRSLKKAKYSEVNDIHFGLSSKYYSHFTAPIRRYPDLQIHRIIKENITGKMNQKQVEHYERILPEVAEHSSKTERTAEEAERDVEKIKKAEYMERFIGERFEGLISGVTSFGLFVELENTVEGLVSYNSMKDDYYIFDEDRLVAIGENFNKIYSLGDSVEVEVYHVDKEKSIIDFILVTEDMKHGEE